MSNEIPILVSCGEASGDLYLSELLLELRRRLPALRAFGLGGERAKRAGTDLVVHLDEISVIGLVEVLRKLPALQRAMRLLLAQARARRPAAAILVDFSGFNLRLGKRLHALGIPILYYVSPQVWAWRRGRLSTIREIVDQMLVILPFEEAFYRDEGIEVRYVGHPLVDLVRSDLDRLSFCSGLGLKAERPIVMLLPGSRRSEVELHVPVLRRVVRLLGTRRPELQFIMSRAPTVPPRVLLDALAEDVDRVRLLDPRPADGLIHATAAVVASGTATIEAALSGTPMVVVYRVGRLSYALGRSFVRVPHFSMVNLVAGREVVPELIQDAMTPEAIATQLTRILDDGPARTDMMRGLDEVREKLGGGGASARAADAVLTFLQSKGGKRVIMTSSTPSKEFV
ncbi:MAG TPA: lipid-A-disaccharide synthase [Vicinamibacteria bacterium]|nr:lipid-A-disaccharide synthase [Vicinamibacteria bacterium]